MSPFSRKKVYGGESMPLQHGFRFLRPPLPAPSLGSLAAFLPSGEGYGLTTFHRCPKDGEGPASPPVVRQLHQRSEEPLVLTTYLCGPSLSASLACST